MNPIARLTVTTPDGTSGELSRQDQAAIVNTTAYLRNDALALSLAGSKSLFHSRLGILEFAQDCSISNPRERVRELIDATYDALKANHHLRDEIAPVFTAIEYCAGQFHESFR